MDKTSHAEHGWIFQARNIIYYILGVIEVLLGFRLIFRLLGASTGSSFVVFLYSATRFLTLPFTGIFKAFASDKGSGFVFEPATVIAMIVYAIAARGIVGLIRLKALNPK